MIKPNNGFSCDKCVQKVLNDLNIFTETEVVLVESSAFFGFILSSIKDPIYYIIDQGELSNVFSYLSEVVT